MDIVHIIKRVTAPLARRVRLMVGRGVVELVDDSLKMQGLQVTLLDGEVRDGVERMQQYGFTGRPFKDAEALLVAVGGNRGHLVAVAIDDRRYRPKTLAEGEVALYTHEGIKVLCKVGGEVHLGDAPTDFVALAASVKTQLDGIQGDLTILKTHTHPTGVGPSGPSVEAATMTYVAASVAAAKVKAK